MSPGQADRARLEVAISLREPVTWEHVQRALELGDQAKRDALVEQDLEIGDLRGIIAAKNFALGAVERSLARTRKEVEVLKEQLASAMASQVEG